MGLEIERRFVVVNPPEVSPADGVFIEQGYLVFGSEGGEVRLRRAGTRCTLTVKSGEGLTREETEVALTEEQFESLWPRTVGRRLTKERFRLRVAEHLLEIDRYRGELAALVVAEVEFTSEDASRRFVPPAWCAHEVTEDPRFRNSAVVQLSATDLATLLSNLGSRRS